MKNRTRILILCAVILGAIYAYKFTDWFAEKKIQIKYRSLPVRKSSASVEPITFYLDKPHQITSLRVVSLADAATNKYPRAIWHLVADTNSVPVTDFDYGVPIQGMKPKIAGLPPEPLKPNESYRIYLETATLKGEKDFQTRGRNGK